MIEEINELVKEGLLKEVGIIKPNRELYEFSRERIREIFKQLLERLGEKGFYLATIVGTDMLKDKKIRLDYYVVVLPEETTIVLRTYVDRDNPEINSILDLIPAALAPECEIHDLLGVVFKGNPALRRPFFVPEELVEKGIYPLRKDARV